MLLNLDRPVCREEAEAEAARLGAKLLRPVPATTEAKPEWRVPEPPAWWLPWVTPLSPSPRHPGRGMPLKNVSRKSRERS